VNIIKEVAALSPLRRNQQIMSFYLLFVNALLGAAIVMLYVDLFNADGLVLKNYALSVLGLAIFIPALGKMAKEHPMRTFHIAIGFEVLAFVFYMLTIYDVFPHVILPIATIVTYSSNIIMSPILNQTTSIVTAGCADYSLLKSKLDMLYTAIGAAVGACFVIFDVHLTVVMVSYASALAMARYYRHKVLTEIYKDTPENILDSDASKA